MTQAQGFANLHNHSEYSTLDGMQHIEDMFAIAAEFGQPGLGITDHGTAAGIAVASGMARKYGVKLVPGIEAYFVPSYQDLIDERHHLVSTRKDGKKHFATGKSFFESRFGVSKQRFHMTLLATSNAGFADVSRMASQSVDTQSGLNVKFPLFDTSLIARNMTSGDVIATTGCIGSFANQLYLAGREDEAMQHVMDMADLFGRDNFFIEVMPHNFPDQLKVQRWHIDLAKRTGLEMLATNDSHYIRETDAQTHELFLQINTQGETFKFSSHENFFAPTDFMNKSLPADVFGNAVANSLAVVERTTFDLASTGEYHIPLYPVHDGFSSEKDMLRSLCEKGFKLRYPIETPELRQRLELELDVIDKMGFNGYFLIVWDALNWGRSRGIRIGPGRGSAAGSMVCYTLNITDIEPTEHRLMFERFLNPSRITMPDIDIDIESSRRGEMFNYMAQKYGHDHVARIATYGKMRPKQALKDAAKVFGLNAEQVGWSDMVNTGKQGDDVISLSEVLADSPPERDKTADAKEAEYYWNLSRRLREEYNSGTSDTRKVLDFAANVQGYYRSRGIHAAGMIVTPGPCEDYFPLVSGDEYALACAYDKNIIDDLGFLKMDFLGLSNLSAISVAEECILRDLGESVSVDNLTLDDPKVFKVLADGDTQGVFQMDSHGMTDLAMRIGISSFADISATIALYRPGPLSAGIHNQYVDAKNGKAVDLIHPDLEELLGETFGLCIYQEQISAIAVHFAGYSMAEADTFRKAVGKKDKAILEKQESMFKERMGERGYDSRTQNELWDMILGFAQYAFNKAHTAAYGKIAYQTAWLKRYYPAQFGAGVIESLPDGKRMSYISDVVSKGFAVLPPDVNRSQVTTSTIQGSRRSEDSIILSLSDILGVGHNIAKVIVDERLENGRYESIFDFVERVDARKRSVEQRAKDAYDPSDPDAVEPPNPSGVGASLIASLAESGAFDGLLEGVSRESLIANARDIVMRLKSVTTTSNGEDDSLLGLFGDEDNALLSSVSWGDLQEKLEFDSVDTNPIHSLVKQRTRLGFFPGKHPMDLIDGVWDTLCADYDLDGVVTIDALEGESKGARVSVIGVVTTKNAKVSDGRKPFMLTIEGSGGHSITVASFGETRQYMASSCEVGDVVIVDGVYQKDNYTGDWRISYQSITAIDLADLPLSAKVLDLPMAHRADLMEKVFPQVLDMALSMSGKSEGREHPYTIRFFAPGIGARFVKDPSTGQALKILISDSDAAKIKESYRALLL